MFFDDFKVEHVKSPIVQQDDYYPFGLTFNSYQRENSVLNKWKFQGQEHVDDLGLNWDSFKWRNHQPDIGRFFNIDPLAEKYYFNSPYAFSENKVVAHVELEGLEAEGVNPKNEEEMQKPKEQPKQQANDESLIKGTAAVMENSYVGGIRIGGIGLGVEAPAETKDLAGVRDNNKADQDITRTTGELTIGPVTVGHEGVSDKKNDVPGSFNGQNAESNTYFGFGPYRYT